jgi:hypothetical protein
MQQPTRYFYFARIALCCLRTMMDANGMEDAELRSPIRHGATPNRLTCTDSLSPCLPVCSLWSVSTFQCFGPTKYVSPLSAIETVTSPKVSQFRVLNRLRIFVEVSPTKCSTKIGCAKLRQKTFHGFITVKTTICNHATTLPDSKRKQF